MRAGVVGETGGTPALPAGVAAGTDDVAEVVGEGSSMGLIGATALTAVGTSTCADDTLGASGGGALAVPCACEPRVFVT